MEGRSGGQVMAELLMTKTPSGALMPASEEEAEKLRKIKSGATVRCDIRQMRNYQFHKKFFSLVKFLFDIWEEGVPRRLYRGVEVQPNLDRFRKDLIILSGRYDATYNVRNEVRLEAKSISFANMSEEEFERLFSDVINIALERVINRPDLSEEKIREYCDQLMQYD